MEVNLQARRNSLGKNLAFCSSFSSFIPNSSFVVTIHKQTCSMHVLEESMMKYILESDRICFIKILK